MIRRLPPDAAQLTGQIAAEDPRLLVAIVEDLAVVRPRQVVLDHQLLVHIRAVLDNNGHVALQNALGIHHVCAM